MHTRTITVQLALSQYGDALIYGINERDDYVSGLLLKQQLFAWHEESFYGTELTTQNADGVELVILPAEQVIPFFADLKVLQHIGWSWEGNAALVTALAPVLAALLDEKQSVPTFSAFREGQLRWDWDGQALAGAVRSSRPAAAPLPGLQERSTLAEGLQAAFAAAVFQRSYSTEAEAGDLRSEFPLLFSRSGLAAAGMDADSWLLSIGCKADSAPFRPPLHLLEPAGDSS
ncbi:hypothetical protein AMQ83_34040 [Paenibacillus riograndensis]|nr:hypothetical protein AMQ83_34040 [Paenibacillus riograndensis]